MKSAKQARILGIAYGFDSKRWSGKVRDLARILGIAHGFDSERWNGKVRDLEGTNEVLDAGEWQIAYGKWLVEGHLCKSIEISRGRNARADPVCIIDPGSPTNLLLEVRRGPCLPFALLGFDHTAVHSRILKMLLLIFSPVANTCCNLTTSIICSLPSSST